MGTEHRGEVITFYSFKGGVGRSMALANIAALEAQRGERVLALDFDFEAPGLHRYFLKPEKPERHTPASAQLGVLDLFAALRDRLRSTFPEGRGLKEPDVPAKLRKLVAEQVDSGKYLYEVRIDDPNSRKPRTVSIDFIAAARFDVSYPELVRSFDWQGFYDDYAEVFPALVNELGSRYDLILVDSRTGVTDIGSICTMALPDKLVLVFSSNEQSLAGALDAGWQAVQGRKEAAAPRELGIFPLLSRVEEGEEEQKRTWVRRARERFEKLAGEAYRVAECDLEAYFDAIRIPHRGYYAYGERIAVEEQPVRESGSLAQMYDRLADSLEYGGVIEAQRQLAHGEGSTGVPSDVAGELLIKLLEVSKLSERPTEAIRAYDDLIRQIIAVDARGVAGLDVMLAEVLGQKVDALFQLYRFGEATDVCREIIRRYGASNKRSLRLQVDRATFNLGSALTNLGRRDEALDTFESLIARAGARTDAHAAEVLARALFGKGNILQELNKHEEAIQVYGRLESQLRTSPLPTVQTQIVKAMTNKATSLATLGDSEASIKVLNEVLVRYGESNEPEQRQAVAVAWSSKIAAIAARMDSVKVLAECDDMLRRFAGDSSPEVLRCVILASALKSSALSDLGRKQDALTALDAMMARVGAVRSPIIAEPLASALSLRAVYLRDMGRTDEARAARKALVRRFRSEPDGLAKKAVVDALIGNLHELNTSGRFEDALAVVNDLLEEYPESTDPRVRGNLYGLIISKALLLGSLERYDEALASADQAYERLAAAPDTEARALLPRALGVMGFVRLCRAKQVWKAGDEAGAHALLKEAAPMLQEALDHTPAEPFVMGNAAYVAFLLDQPDNAREMLTRAIALGGSKVREAEFKDADICTLPQDEAFRELVRSIPDASPA